MSSPERSYIGYAENYTVRVEADRPLLKMAIQQVHHALDIGVGTGTGIEDLIDMRVVIEPYKIIGIDLDEYNLKRARQNPHLQTHPDLKNEIILEKGDAENLIQIPSTSQELVLCRNMIHLTNARRVFNEMYRVLEPGGTILVSSGYINDVMYPPPQEVSKTRWGLMLALARQKLVKEYGFDKKDIPDPDLPDKYSSKSLIRLAGIAGFKNVITNITPENPSGQVVYLDANAIQGLINWSGFAEGALPISNVEIAKHVLSESLQNPKLKGKKYPRGIFYLKAQKPY